MQKTLVVIYPLSRSKKNRYSIFPRPRMANRRSLSVIAVSHGFLCFLSAVDARDWKKKKKVSEKWSMAWRPLHSIEESNVNIESAMRRLVPGTGLSGSVKRDGG